MLDSTDQEQGELSYKERLTHLDLLPVTYDRKVKDLVGTLRSETRRL